MSNEAGSSLVSITVLSVTPLRAGRLFALASVEIDIDGVRIEVRGIRAMRVPTGATRVELPTFRDAAGQSRAAIFGLLLLACTMLCASLIVALLLHQPGEAAFPGLLFLVLAVICWKRRSHESNS